MTHRGVVRGWWIDGPGLLGSRSPGDVDLEELRRNGFSVIVCLLDLREQRLDYDRSRASASGWEWHNIPVPDFAAPTLEQINEFLVLVESSIPAKKVLVHCRGGIGRTGTMAAAYWISKGLSSQAALARVRARQRYAVENPEQEARLRDFERTRNVGRGARRTTP
jgi:protein-tyrosine phosphatase